MAFLKALTRSERVLMDRNHLERCHDVGAAANSSPATQTAYVSLEAEIPEVLYRG